MPVRFDAFELDEGRRQLLRSGEPLHLPAKQFSLLQILIERRPNAVSKRELYDRLWPNTYVSDVNLPTLVAELRTTLGDHAHRPRFIRTIHGFGYAFCGATEGGAPEPKPRAIATLIGAGIDISLGIGETVVGRDPSLNGTINDRSISRRHARIVCDGKTATLHDLGSKNGTFVAGVRVTTPVTLTSGDAVTFGGVQLVYRESPSDTTITIHK